MRPAGADRAKAVLIGVSAYQNLPQLPNVAKNLRSLALLVADPEYGAADARNCVTVENPATPRDVMRNVIEASIAADTSLIVYFSGHGLIDLDSGALFLSVTGSVEDDLETTAVSFEYLLRRVSASRARHNVIILDCCYSGRALGRHMATADVLARYDSRGVAILTSGGPNDLSQAADDELRFTLFSGELIDILTRGLPEQTGLLSMRQIYQAVAMELSRARLLLTNAGGDVPIIGNRAYDVTGPAESEEPVAGPAESVPAVAFAASETSMTEKTLAMFYAAAFAVICSWFFAPGHGVLVYICAVPCIAFTVSAFLVGAAAKGEVDKIIVSGAGIQTRDGNDEQMLPWPAMQAVQLRSARPGRLRGMRPGLFYRPRGSPLDGWKLIAWLDDMRVDERRIESALRAFGGGTWLPSAIPSTADGERFVLATARLTRWMIGILTLAAGLVATLSSVLRHLTNLPEVIRLTTLSVTGLAFLVAVLMRYLPPREVRVGAAGLTVVGWTARKSIPWDDIVTVAMLPRFSGWGRRRMLYVELKGDAGRRPLTTPLLFFAADRRLVVRNSVLLRPVIERFSASIAAVAGPKWRGELPAVPLDPRLDESGVNFASRGGWPSPLVAKRAMVILTLAAPVMAAFGGVQHLLRTSVSPLFPLAGLIGVIDLIVIIGTVTLQTRRSRLRIGVSGIDAAEGQVPWDEIVRVAVMRKPGKEPSEHALVAWPRDDCAQRWSRIFTSNQAGGWVLAELDSILEYVYESPTAVDVALKKYAGRCYQAITLMDS